MTGNLEADCPLYDVIFSSMSKGWPQFEEDLEVCTLSTETQIPDLPSANAHEKGMKPLTNIVRTQKFAYTDPRLRHPRTYHW